MTDGQMRERREVALMIQENRVSTEEEQLPYPNLAPVVFRSLTQTTRPRNWCLQIACGPYPFLTAGSLT
ncbi:hypothetical protein CesoFtcFv8_010325 [Champsocephalus esox]|uniref:Uncharacterized protein n=2 Tax=Champsocephalus TaxID=52236 RepID=A0AAN8HR40_CHAGU|nr:hypothetical protein CesoFtcFv8_010325 [Champsocephalus esox]KAK5925251.1 hypothetical protein CgunFtcFv8_017789 [Champsocephalus gunnari]